MRLEPSARYSNLTVLRDRGFGGVECRCDCGATRVCSRDALQSGESRACLECQLKMDVEKRVRGNALLKGQRFGALEVVKDRGARNVLCRCDCGDERAYDRGNLVKATRCNDCRRKALGERMSRLHEEHTKCR